MLVFVRTRKGVSNMDMIGQRLYTGRRDRHHLLNVLVPNTVRDRG